MTIYNTIVVGSGPAGIGIASLLSQAGNDYIVLEKKQIGNSFIQFVQTFGGSDFDSGNSVQHISMVTLPMSAGVAG